MGGTDTAKWTRADIRAEVRARITENSAAIQRLKEDGGGKYPANRAIMEELQYRRGRQAELEALIDIL